MFVTPAFAQSAAPAGGADIFMSILPFILIFVIMYFLIIRPQRTQMKKREEMLKNVRRGRIHEYAEKYGCPYWEGERPWKAKCDVALPCATQNEISGTDAVTLLENGCVCVAEGANMPSEPEAVEHFLDKGILFGPGKAANAGGVAVSGLEMSQNSMRLSWTRDEVDQRLRVIMSDIHRNSLAAAEYYGVPGNYVAGANIAGFLKVANAMLDQGVV